MEARQVWTLAQSFHLNSCIVLAPDLINLGFEAPGGQMFSTVNDLAQLLMLVFRSDKALDPKQKQVSTYQCYNGSKF